jgi:hypothetical protein
MSKKYIPMNKQSKHKIFSVVSDHLLLANQTEVDVLTVAWPRAFRIVQPSLAGLALHLEECQNGGKNLSRN